MNIIEIYNAIVATRYDNAQFRTTNVFHVTIPKTISIDTKPNGNSHPINTLIIDKRGYP